jgi:hypothetical protein
VTDARATQVALEQWAQGTPQAQVTQVALEQWARSPPGTIAVTQASLEEWVQPQPALQVTQAAIEEWGSVAVVTPPTGGFVGFNPSARTVFSAANSIFLTKVTAQQNGLVNAVLIDVPQAPIANNLRVLIYDSAHSVLLAQSAIIASGLVVGYNRLPLTSPLTIAPGDYWIGYVSDAAVIVTIQINGATSWYASGGQSVITPANPLAAGVTSANGLMIALELDAGGALQYGFGTDRAANVALSGSNRIATVLSGSNQGARSVVTRYPSNGGKWYAEIDIGGTVASDTGVGLAVPTWGVTQGTGNLAYFALLLTTGVLTTGTSLGLSYGAGDTVGIAYDAVHNLVWWNKNNGAWFGASATAGDPVGGTGGLATETTWPETIAAAIATATLATFTLRDTIDALRYTVPTGYSPWSSYILPTYVPPPPPPPAKGTGSGKNKQPPGKTRLGPPALRAEGRLDALEPSPRKRVYAPWGLPPVTAQALAEGSTGSAALSATVIHSAALTESAITTAAIASGRILAALLAEGATASDALSAALRAVGALAESSHGSDALASTALRLAHLADGAMTSDMPYHGVTAPGMLSESAATSAAITAFLATHAGLTEGSVTTAAVAGFRTLPAALAEAAAGLDAIAGIGIRHASLAEQAAATDALQALAHMLADVREATEGQDDLQAVATLQAALAEAASTLEADRWIGSTRPFRGAGDLIGRHSDPTLQAERSSPTLEGGHSAPNLEGGTETD